ncbi:Uncharacterized protein OBRU01_05885 [Operophtera brumata]|uniref:ZAD domain-containing protein n=1 Tax=Operophtera brumata TaxID=104452 RepID=A0A0L7LLK5_OPEBR|nr:Uncharacterized protein OBRU01_05885 [Operophtera brumata]
MADLAGPVNSKGPVLDPGLCRCCRSIKKCRFLSAEYEWTGQKEIYSDMFMDCFGLLLSNLDGDSKDCCICATCVVRLRDACAFRRQVLQCEQALLSLIQSKEGNIACCCRTAHRQQGLLHLCDVRGAPARRVRVPAAGAAVRASIAQPHTV